jgi:lipid-A-disaccharide synthase
MKPKTFMIIAGEASGDMLAAELVSALRAKVLEEESAPTNDVQPLRTQLAPKFFGAGGPKMAAAGVELAFDMTKHSVIGISDVLKNYLKFRRLFNQLLKLAIERQPDVIIGVDYGGFNLRFGHAIKQYVRKHSGIFQGWNPKIVQFVSPQVWASRPGRAYQIARDYDLLLSIFPFEKDWYARRVPKLRVEFVGHPMVERFQKAERGMRDAEQDGQRVLLLPGSRASELRRHLPVMIEAAKLIVSKEQNTLFSLVLPNEQLVGNLFWEFAKKTNVAFRMAGPPTPSAVESCASNLGLNLKVQIGNLPQALMRDDVAIASTGTVTMECAFFGVPTVTLYKTSVLTYEIAKRIVMVKSLTMPNLLAGKEVYPEFIQNAATPENIADAALELLQNESRRVKIKTQLANVVASLGGPGASTRAAGAIVGLLEGRRAACPTLLAVGESPI